MKAKYVQEIYNLVTPTKTNMAMSVKELRAAIDNVFTKNTFESIAADKAKRAKDLQQLKK